MATVSRKLPRKLPRRGTGWPGVGARTIRTFREALTSAQIGDRPAIVVFEPLDAALRQAELSLRLAWSVLTSTWRGII